MDKTKKSRSVIILLILSILFFSVYSHGSETEHTDNININSSSNAPTQTNFFVPQLMNDTLPYVLSELILSLDNPIIGVVDNTLSFPVYHDKYGSYILAKRTGLSYTNYERNVTYIGIEMEDSIIRYFPRTIIRDAYYGLCPYENISVENQPFEKLYFNGAMTEEIENNTLTYLLSMTDGHPDNLLYSFYDIEFKVYANSEEILFLLEDDILNHLLNTEYFKGCEKIISYFGKKCIYNPTKDTYIFITENGPNSLVYLKEIYKWTMDKSLSDKQICLNNFSFDTATGFFTVHKY